LVETHRTRGIEPDAWTATPLWHGEALDYGLALDMLRPPLARAGQEEQTVAVLGVAPEHQRSSS
ncbi:hypothetical protein ACFL3S_07145, partial [Gemmatimonadota bacterium]